MPGKAKTTTSLSEAMFIGLAACAYAREKIVKGSTQLENNLLSNNRFKALKGAIGEKSTMSGLSVRAATEQRVLSEITASSSDFSDNIETAIILQYESTILMSGKYSLGNCAELSMQALDYILNRVKKNIHAEMYYIKNGDHVFLVLNRAKHSIINRPETWGDDTVICDPWANQVYPVAMLPSRLKNFFRNKLLDINFIEDYDKNIHVLDSMQHYNTKFLREAQKKYGSTKYLIWHFKDKLIRLLKLLREHASQLKTESQRLRTQYGDEDTKVIIMRTKISEINNESRRIVSECNQLILDIRDMSFPAANKILNKRIKKTYNDIETIIQFSPAEQAALYQHRGSQLKTDLMAFFKVKPQTQTVVDEILAKTSRSLSRKFK